MRKVWMGALAGLVALWSCAALPISVRAEDDELYAEKLLPPETLFFFSIPSVADFHEAAAESSFGKLRSEPKLQPFLNDVHAKLEDLYEKNVEGPLGVSLKDLMELPQGELTFAVVEKPARKVALLLLVDTGENSETRDTLIEKMDDALKNSGADHSTQDIGDLEVHIYKLPVAGNNPIKTLAYFTDEGYVVFGTEVAALKSVIERWNGDSDDSLAKQETFAYIQKQCASGEDEEPLVKWYFNPIGSVQAAIGMVQGQNPQAGLVLGMLPILGLDHLKGMGGAVDFGVGEFDATNKSFIYVDQPASGVLGIFNFPATEQAPPAWVSGDSATYVGMNWSLDEAYSSIESLVDSFQGPGSLARVLDGFAQDGDGPQVHVKKDLIDQLNGRVHLVAAPTDFTGEQPQVPNMVFGLGLKNADQMKKTLAKAAKSDGFAGKTRVFQGATIYEMPADNDMTLSLATVGDLLVFATDTPQLEQMIRGPAAKPLVRSPAYLSLAKHFPKKTSLIGFGRQDVQMKAFYDAMKKQDNDALEGIDLTKLPDWSALSKYFQPSGSYVVPDKKGALFVGFSLGEAR